MEILTPQHTPAFPPKSRSGDHSGTKTARIRVDTVEDIAEASKSDHFRAANLGLDYDVLIIGAGFSGIYMVKRLIDLGLRVKILEAGPAEGGTWYWNRYPGARFDSESWSYGYSWSKEILDEWHWKEHFSPQPETLKYINFITDKFNLRQHMQFNTKVKAAHFQDQTGSWLLTDYHGKMYTSRYLITCIGILNEPTPPNIPGVGTFTGKAFHTARWPEDGVAQLRGKRVGIIGTGATAIQTIQAIKEDFGSLVVFQRTPNWSAPLRNAEISDQEMAEIRQDYPNIFRKCNESYSCFVHEADTRSVFDIPEEQRLQEWEELYSKRGFAKVLSIPRDIFTDKAANKLYSDFHAAKIRSRVKDPVTAEKLIPKCHGIATRRLPLESGYFEVFNQDNVSLVDIKANPIECIHEKGIRTRDEDIELDVLIYATGFDAVTGSFTAIDFRGRHGRELKEIWSGGIRTFLGLTIEDMPNMLTVMGPHQMFGNFVRSIEYAVDWTARYIAFALESDIRYIEPTLKGVDAWTEHVHDVGKGLLANEVDSWMTGVNKNVAHKQVRSMTRYNGPAPGYRKRAEDVAQRRYEDFTLR